MADSYASKQNNILKDLLLREEMNGERIICNAMVIISLVVILVIFIIILNSTQFYWNSFVDIATSGFLVLYSVCMFFILRKGVYKPYFKYMTMTVNAAFITLLLAGYAVHDGLLHSLRSAVVAGYIAVIAISGLYRIPSITVYTTLISISAYTGIFLTAIITKSVVMDKTETFYKPVYANVIYFTYLLFFLVTGGVIIYISYRLKALLMSALKTEAEKKEVELTSEMRTNFFVNIAHETKTPLAVIKNSLDDYIHQNGMNRELEEIKYHIERLERNMINFLDSEKLQRGQVFYDHVQVFDLSAFLEKKIILFEKTARKKKIELKHKVEKGITVKADSFAVDRIINNLIDNSLKYNRENGWILVELSRKDDKIYFSVGDSGIGISKEDRLNIFKPYYQLAHQKRNLQGIGMGLAIVSEILKTLQGEIAVESHESEGSRFTVKLPGHSVKPSDRIDEDLTVSMPMDELEYELIDNAGQNDQNKDTLLVVEDNASLLSRLKEKNVSRYNVLCAYNGREALNILENSQKPALIVTDIMMDDMDGYELFNRLKNDSRFRDIPFIFLTAKTTEMENIEGLSMGALDYIFKPFSMDVLSAKIESLIHYQKMKKELAAKNKFAALGQFSAGISHEILNPMQGVKGYLSLIKSDHPDIYNSPELNRYFDSMYENTERVETFIKTLREMIYYKPDQTEKVNLIEMAEMILNIYRQKLKNRINFQLDIPEDFIIHTNKGLLNQVLLNLINNAVDSIPERGGITLSAKMNESKYTIQVSDTGTGIEKDNLKRIFDIGFSTKRKTGGSGLGLYLVKEILSGLDMEIKIESELNKGTTISLFN